MSTGAAHSLIIDGTNQLYVFGDNKFQQLGLKGISKVCLPYKTKFLVKQAKAGETHNIILTIQSQVFTWGANFMGQCG